MPRIKRWFPVSHDINTDPEVWEMRNTFGEQTLAVWLQMLSIADRNEGEIKGDIDWIARSLTYVWGTNSKRYNTEWRRNKIRMTIEWMSNKNWIRLSAGSIVVNNYAKYHITREQRSSPPTRPTRPDLYKNKNRDNTSQHDKHVEEWPSPQLLIQKWNDKACDELSAVEKVTPARIKKAKEYLRIFPEEKFWDEVIQEVNASSFLRGLRPSANGHGSFKASFDWLLTKGKDGTENAAKVFEGRYRDERRR